MCLFCQSSGITLTLATRLSPMWRRPGAFGKIVQTNGNPRLIQFSLRWAF